MSDLLSHDVLVISQKAKLIEMTDEYRVFDDAGIEIMAERPGARRWGWANIIQFHELPFCFGNDLMFQDQDIPGDEFLFLMLQRVQKKSGESGSGTNLGLQVNRNDAQVFGVRARGRTFLSV